MNLLALQYIDITRSLNSAFETGLSAKYFTRIERDEGGARNRYAVMERTRRTTSDTGRKISPSSNEIVLKAGPLFPNSLLSTEVGLAYPAMTAIEASQGTHPYPAQPQIALDLPAANSLYYRLHDPIPGELGSQLYREGDHVVGILQDESSLAKTDTALIHKLHLLLNPVNEKQTDREHFKMQIFLDDHTSRLRSPRKNRVDSLDVEMRKFSHLWHRLNVIGKTSLLVCDTAGIAVDAIRSSVPSVFSSEVPIGFESLQACVTRFLQHQKLLQLIEEQKTALDEIARSQHQYEYLMSNTGTLRSLVRARLNQADFIQTMAAIQGRVLTKKTP